MFVKVLVISADSVTLINVCISRLERDKSSKCDLVDTFVEEYSNDCVSGNRFVTKETDGPNNKVEETEPVFDSSVGPKNR